MNQGGQTIHMSRQQQRNLIIRGRCKLRLPFVDNLCIVMKYLQKFVFLRLELRALLASPVFQDGARMKSWISIP